MNGWKFWKVLKMSLHDYLELFRQFKEHKHIKGGDIIEAILPDVSDIMDEVLGFL